MKWYDLNWWKAALVSILVIYSTFLLVGCRTPKTLTKQTFITDRQNENKWDSLINARLLSELEIFQNVHKETIEIATKEKSYVKDSTSSRYDSDGKKIGEDKYHYERHEISSGKFQQLKDSVSLFKSYVDSTTILHSKCDSLEKVISNYTNDVEYIKKPLTKMQKMFLETGQMFYFCLVIVAIYLIYIKRKEKGS